MATGLGINLQNPPPPRNARPQTSSTFRLPSSSSASSSRAGNDDENDTLDEDAPLPFPTALARRDFLTPDFSAAAYLSSLFPSSDSPDPNNVSSNLGGTLAHRHQTLEDLRAELRERSSAISTELLELVNANYTSFLSLGDELKGGEDRVEDVRVALLGFGRQVEEVKGRVRGRKEDVYKAGHMLKSLRGDIEVGRKMLELDERLDVLQGKLDGACGPEDEDWNSDEDEEENFVVDDDDDDERGYKFTGSSPAELTNLARELTAIEKLADVIGRNLPYVQKMEERITRCRNTLLLDLDTSMKDARRAGKKGHNRVLKLLGIYRVLGANAQGVRIVRDR